MSDMPKGNRRKYVILCELREENPPLSVLWGRSFVEKNFCIKDGIELPKEILQMHFAGILIIMQYMIIVKLGKKQSSIVNFGEDIW